MADGTRIAVLTHGYAPSIGGIERQRAAVTPRLVQRGMDALVITRAVRGVPRHEIANGVRVLRTPAVDPGAVPRPARPVVRAVNSGLYTAYGLAALLRHRPAVIHTHEFLSTARLGLAAGRLLRVPVIVTAHLSGPRGDVQRSWTTASRRRLLRGIRRGSALAIAVSSEIDRELASAGFAQRRIVENGVDTDRFRPAEEGERRRLQRRLGVVGAPLVVFAGRLVRQKRVDLLLDAWETIAGTWPGARLLIIGDGEERQRLQQAAPSSVMFRGPVADTAEYVRAADIFVLASDGEGLSNALLEAQASGVPAVCTDVGAARDVVEDGVTGMVVPPGNVRALTDALNALIADPGRRTAMGHAARTRVVERFSVDRTTDGFISAYQHVLGRRPCPSD